MELPKCVLLDLDGTLLDSLAGLEFSIAESLRKEGLTADLTRLPSFIGPPVRIILYRLVPGLSNEVLDRLVTYFRASYDTEGWRKTVLFPHGEEVLRALAASGRRLFVITNKPLHIATSILEQEGVLSLFEQVLTRDSRTPHFTDKAEMIRTVLASTGITTSDAVMVGDTMEDAQAASESGVGFVFMAHGYGDIAAGTPAVRFTGFKEWLPWLAGEEQR